MKKLTLIAAFVASTTLSGCATILQGTEDTVSVHAIGATEKLTECTIKAGAERYSTMGRIDQVVLERDSADLVIECENSTQEGFATVESSFTGAWLLADLLWDLCIITLSCPIDAATGAFYDYPNEIHVEMVNKDGTKNTQLVVDKAELEKAIEAKRMEKANNNPHARG